MASKINRLGTEFNCEPPYKRTLCQAVVFITFMSRAGILRSDRSDRHALSQIEDYAGRSDVYPLCQYHNCILGLNSQSNAENRDHLIRSQCYK